MPRKYYRQKLTRVEAIEFDGANYDEIIAFCPECVRDGDVIRFVTNTMEGPPPPDMDPELLKRINSIEVVPGAFIVKGPDGGFYPDSSVFKFLHDPD